MRVALITGLAGVALIVLPRQTLGQTVGAAAIAQEVHSRLAEQQIPVLPPRVVPPPVVNDALVRERMPPRVAEGLVPTRVTDQLAPAIARVPPVSADYVAPVTPLVARPIVPATAAGAWLNVFSSLRYGFYDDGVADDNWYYDYYQMPTAVAAVEPAPSATPGYRTSWRYDPVAEQRLFRW